MKFDKEKFKENMSFFKYDKKEIKKDLLCICGKIKSYHDYDFIDCYYKNEDLQDAIKRVYGDKIYDIDGCEIYLKKDISLLSIIEIPIHFVMLLLFRIIALMVMLIVTPFIFANNMILSK